jgi:hypothetical protein
MDRIARKLPSFGTSSQDQIAICLGFARNVLHEHWRDEDVFYEGHDLNEYPSGENENALNEMRALCLENCLGRLGDDNKQLILKYHEYEPGGKIGHRKMMAEARHISLNALRLKACRLKSELTPCLKNCIQFGGMTKVQ